MKPIDSHTHIDDTRFQEDFSLVYQRVEESLSAVINIGCDIESSKRSIELAERYEKIFATVGIHPHDANRFTKESALFLKEYASHPKVVALGEIGLDYHYLYSTKEEQRFAFREQLSIASQVNLPVVVHMREATQECAEILSEYPSVRGVLHSYSGSYETAMQLIERFYFSFSGTVTFKNAERVREVVKQLPLDRILIETDAPYLTPVPFRGNRNEPSYVIYIAEKIAEIKGVSYDEVVAQTKMNTYRLFSKMKREN